MYTRFEHCETCEYANAKKNGDVVCGYFEDDYKPIEKGEKTDYYEACQVKVEGNDARRENEKMEMRKLFEP